MSVTSDEQTAAADGGKPRSALDLPALRARLAAQDGRQYWRSLDELADTEEFRSFVEREFPDQTPHLLDPVGRRSFIKLMGASLALAGVSACTRQPTETVFPYVKAPEYIVPGIPLFFATAMPVDGIGTGLLVESQMGRPTKIEATPTIRPARAPPTCWRRRRCWGSTIPIAHRSSATSARCRPGAISAPR
jgi:MoCo/4Fe-4S cofactor protein with predicted Tat translocation signal